MRSGQAIIFTLMFLIPMVVALGLLMRVDSTINLKIRLQDATDAAAQEGGAQVARVMNQIAVHNMAIVKYHALQAATKTAKLAADATLAEATNQLTKAQAALQCWQQAVQQHTDACNPITNQKECDRIQPSTDCVTCMTTQVEYWTKIVSFWQTESQFFDQQSQQFESVLGQMCKQLGNKSDGMVTQLDQHLKDLYTRIGREHRLHINTPENRQWLTSSKEDRPMRPGQWNPDRVFKKGTLKFYQDLALKGAEKPGGETDRGIFNFEGPPQQVTGEMADKKSAGKQVDPPWGPARYYLEYIYSVHIGLPGYFKFNTMHGPLGNPDSDNATCGGGQHDGCEKKQDQARYVDAQIGCQQGAPCHPDVKPYTAEFFHDKAEQMLPGQMDQEFGSNDHIVYQLADTPKLEFLVGGVVEADQGYFNRLFKSRTVDMPDDGPRDPNQSYLHALAKFELYNLSETNGKILSRGDYGQYKKALLAQDWNAVMTPIVKEEINQERTVIKDNMVH